LTVIEVVVDEPSWRASVCDVEAVVETAATAALVGRSVGEVAVLLASDDAVKTLNQRFRGKDAATNVLSFPAAAGAGPHLGDVALAFGVCEREARAQGKRLEDHLRHLVVHGVLHLIGYDHEHPGEAEAMEALERSVLIPLGVADPYRGGD
jgi:probable rRNA maturation factor